MKNQAQKILSKKKLYLNTISRQYFYFVVTIVVTEIFIASSLFAQRTQLNYKVIQGSNELGWLKLEKIDSANTSFLQSDSQVKKRIIFLFTIIEHQEAYFLDEVMMKSYIFRKINDDIKENKHTVYGNNYYTVNNKKSVERVLLGSIYHNQLSLYFLEPVNLKQIYSDSYQRLLNIEKETNHVYKINFPDGNVNHYYYTNGICSKVKVERSLFTIEFILKP